MESYFSQVEDRTHNTDAQTSHGRQTTAYCEDCIVPQTVKHIMSECPSFTDERRRCFGPGPYSMKDMLDGLHCMVHGHVHRFLIQIHIYTKL